MDARGVLMSGVTVAGLVAGVGLADTSWAQMSDFEESERHRSGVGVAAGEDGADLEQAAEVVVRKTNQFRESEGLSAVEVNEKLAATARDFASFMASNDTYGHTADGQRPSGRAKEQGYEFCLVSENIAYRFRSTGYSAEQLGEAFVEGWKESPGHRENMLDPDVTETGVGIARSDETGYYYAVQMFGRPKSSSIEFSIANESGASVEYAIRDRTFDLPPNLIRTHTQCRPSEVSFRSSAEQRDRQGDESQKSTDENGLQEIKPKDGEHYVVRGSEGQLRVEKGEQPDLEQ